MKAIGYLVKRNFYMFFRDKMAVFFAFMSMLVVIALMVLFLGNMNIDQILELLKTYGGRRDAIKDKENAKQLIELWTVAGVLTVNSVMVSLSAMGVMVEDSAQNKRASFYVAPLPKTFISLGYILSSIGITVLMCLLTMGISQFYVIVRGGEFFGLGNIFKIAALIILQSILFSLFMYLIASVTKSASAWSALGTIIGTLVGFLGAIYLPMGSIPQKVANGLTYLPVLHGTSLIRRILTNDMISKTFYGLPSEIVEEYKKAMGITIEMGGNLVDIRFQIGFLVICAIIILGIIIGMEQKK